MKKLVNKTVNLDMIDATKNAFLVISVFKIQAQIDRWTLQEIETVLTEAKSKDYNHIFKTLKAYCEVKKETKNP